MLDKNELPGVTELNDWRFTVVSADAPQTPLCPGFLTEEEALVEANTLIDSTGCDYLVVDTATWEAQS